MNSRFWKFAWFVQLACFVALFAWYSERDRKFMIEREVTKAYFQAQNEALTTHAKAINLQADITRRLIEALSE